MEKTGFELKTIQDDRIILTMEEALKKYGRDIIGQVTIYADGHDYQINIDKDNTHYGVTFIELNGYMDGSLIVHGDGKIDAYRQGEGNGNVIRSGPGNAIRSGRGNGDASKLAYGDGHALKIGDGEGYATHVCNGQGDAIALSPNSDALRTELSKGKSKGYIIFKNENGDVVRSKEDSSSKSNDHEPYDIRTHELYLSQGLKYEIVEHL